MPPELDLKPGSEATTFTGTAPYMAPESNSAHYNEKVDIYSAGKYSWIDGPGPPAISVDIPESTQALPSPYVSLFRFATLCPNGQL